MIPELRNVTETIMNDLEQLLTGLAKPRSLTVENNCKCINTPFQLPEEFNHLINMSLIITSGVFESDSIDPPARFSIDDRLFQGRHRRD
jgi:hypothetical protein